MKKREITLEYPVNSTVASLFSKLSCEGGLKSWFADDVTRDGDDFVFFWHRIPHRAEMLQSKENKFVRFRWKDEEGDDYFEFRVESSELTGSLSLIVTDFLEEGDEVDYVNIWDANVKRLRRSLGAFA